MQLPVGDKPRLADPVDSPESLGTRSAAVLIDVCTCGNIASYSNSKRKNKKQKKNSVAAISGLVKFDFKAI